jgi:hypothetical protein
MPLRGVRDIIMGYKNPDGKAKYDVEYRKRPYVIEKAIERTKSGSYKEYWHRPKVKERNSARWRTEEYREKDRERSKTKEYKERSRWSYIMRNYGLAKGDFERMLDEQQNKCAICGFEFHDEGKSTRPHIDHCHNSGDVRGLLCSLCNIGLGHFKDDPQRLQSAIEYLT